MSHPAALTGKHGFDTGIFHEFTSVVKRIITGAEKLATQVADLVQPQLILRQEVPIERYYHNYRQPYANTSVEIEAHCYAALYTLEGVVRTAAEFVMAVVQLFFFDDIEAAGQQRDMCILQARSTILTLVAIAAPRTVTDYIAQHSTADEPYVGCLPANFDWGTRYAGQMTIPLTSVEYSTYPHHPVEV